MNNKKNIIIQLLIVLVGAMIYIPFLGQVHLFDWDEINFAEAAREMIVTGDYLTVQIDYQPFWEKPPLFIWMQAFSMNIFGINEFAARFPNAVCGIVTLLVLYNIGRRLVDIRFGILWSFVYLASFLPFFYFKSGIIDPWFNLFIFLGLYFFVLFTDFRGRLPLTRYLIYSAFFLGLAILTKGPVAFLIWGITVFTYWIVVRFRMRITFTQVISFLFVLFGIGGLWFIIQVFTGNYQIVKDFIVYQVRLFQTQDAGHGGFPFYHVVILLLGVFPSSTFAIPGFFKQGVDTPSQRHFRRWMTILFFTVLILFSIVKTKIIHYSSMTYFPVTFFATYFIYKWQARETTRKWGTDVLLVFITIIYIALISLFPLIDKYKTIIIESGRIKDPFALGNLTANVQWSGYELLLGSLLIIGLIFYFVFTYRGKTLKGINSILISSTVFIFLTMIIIIPKIEGYSQHAAILFYKEHKDRNVYINPLGFKSYAHLFYSRKQPVTNNLSYNQNWLLTGEIDKPAYFVIKNYKAEKFFEKYSELQFLQEKNGFVFAVRYPREK